MPQDRVLVGDQQRLDRPDFDALQTLVYTYCSEMLGGVMGASSGLLSPLKYTRSNSAGVYTMTFDHFVCIHTATSATRVEDRGLAGAVNVGAEWASVVHSFDPDDVGHENYPLDYTAARATEIATPGTKPYVWVRPIDVSADVDTRQFWSVAAGTETPVATSTRTRQRLEFAISATTPLVGAGAQWAAIARVMSWAANEPVLYGLSAWGDSNTATMLQDPGDPEDFATDNTTMSWPLERLLRGAADPTDGTEDDWPAGTERSAGLVYTLQWIMSRLQRHVSGGTSDDATTVIRPWWAEPEISLNGAKVALDDHTTDIATNTALIQLLNTTVGVNTANINIASQRHTVLCSGVLTFRPAGVFAAPDNTAGWSFAHGWGVESVSMPGNERTVVVRFKDSLVSGRTSWYITGVSVSPVYAPGRIADPAGFSLAAEMIPDPFGAPSTFAGSGTLNDYKGAAVGLAANQYGLRLHVAQLQDNGASGADLQGVSPADSIMDDVHCWHIAVHISKFDGADVGI